MKITQFSVITVCLNSENTISACIESVRVQVDVEVEHIIVDGASTDNTLAIINGNKCARSIVISEPDRGIYDAMNKGLSLATGDIICFLNSDDEFASDNVLSRIWVERNRSSSQVVLTDVQYVRKNKTQVYRRYSAGRFQPWQLSWGIMPPHPGIFICRSIFDRIGCFDPSFVIAGDFDLVVRLFMVGNLNWKYLGMCSVTMRGGGVSNSGLWSKYKLNREVLIIGARYGLKISVLRLLMKYLLRISQYVWCRKL